MVNREVVVILIMYFQHVYENNGNNIVPEESIDSCVSYKHILEGVFFELDHFDNQDETILTMYN